MDHLTLKGAFVFKLHVLASGSKGNSSVLENTRTGGCILIDCGISKRDFLSRLDACGVDPSRISDVLITHEHTDHTKGLGVVVRGFEKMGIEITLRTSSSVRAASPEIEDALQSENASFKTLLGCDPFEIGGVAITPFPTSHDAAQSFGFRFELAANGTCHPDSLVYLTDSGIITEEAAQALQFARIVALESNHDIDMLMTGAYPYPLKKRISSDRGHLSNNQAACALDELLFSLGGASLEKIVAMHISQKNNTYDLPRHHLGEVLERYAHAADVVVSHQLHSVSVS